VLSLEWARMEWSSSEHPRHLTYGLFSFYLLSSRFHPLVKTTGTILIKGRPVDAAGDAMFVHAIQGMMPNRVSQILLFRGTSLICRP
jgi:hypothetical protein